MHRYLGLMTATLMSLAGAGGALAADMAVKAPVARPALPCAWCGFYVGGNVGYGWGRNVEDSVYSAPVPPFFANDAAAIGAAGSPRLNPNGVTGGVQGGYNWRTGAALFGLEADLGALALRGSTSGTFFFPSSLPGGGGGPPVSSFTASTTVSSDWLLTARGRLGWANDTLLLYGTGGLAVANVKVNQTIQLLRGFVENAGISSTRAGWTIGAGAEIMISRNWSVKGEYLYVDLGKASAAGVLTPAFAGISYNTTAHLTANIARIGANYHFGGPVVAKY